MPALDTPALEQIESGAYAPAYFIFIDIVDDPIRITTYGQSVTFSGTGDSELDGSFIARDPRVIQVGDVTNSESGSDTLTVSLVSGVTSVGAVLMGEIADTSRWRGRTVRLWKQIYDETGRTQQGAIIPYYTGYASSVKITPSPDAQTIQLEVENYYAAFNDASNRNYLSQSDYDAADISAAATIASANMGRGSPSAGGSGGTLSGGGATSGGGHQIRMPDGKSYA